MRKRLVLLFLLLSLVGCNQDEKLIRVDYQLGEMRTGDDGIVTDEDQVNAIAKLIGKVKWENPKVQMTSKEDMMLTFFFQYNPNMPERLEEYKIWFHDNMDAEIVDSNKYRYGKLSREDAEKLQKQIK